MGSPIEISSQDFVSVNDHGNSSSRIIGEGEMADLVRAFDWTSTPLGDVATWSDTLITAVNLLLASQHPMFLWWGPELIQFYNDGYRPSIRADKHPSALGQRGIECWPEIWPIIGPQIEAVMSRGASTWNKNQLVPIKRDGKLEEVYWTYGYSPVRDKEGSIQGTLVVCSETTEHVLSERRLGTLLSITADALQPSQLPHTHPLLPLMRGIAGKLEKCNADFPFAVLYLLTQGEILLAGSTGSARVLANPALWPLLDAVNSLTPLVLEDLHDRFGALTCEPWPEPVTRAYLLPLSLPGSSIQAVGVFGISPRLPFDSKYQTFFQLVGNRISTLLQSEVHELEREQSAERFSRLMKATPFGVVIGDLHGGLTYVNPALLQTLGYSESEVNSGQVQWRSLTPPEFALADAYAIQQLREFGRCDVYEKAYLARDGRRVPILVGAAVISGSASEPEVGAFVTDLTRLKVAEAALRKANDELEKKVTERTASLKAEILDRKQAEASLRELTGRLLTAQDEERRHMARELHDHAGQTLTALGINLATLQNIARDGNQQIVNLAAQSQQLSDALSKEIRTLSYLLHPPLLDEVGLGSALSWYVDGFSQRSQSKVDLHVAEDLGRLPRELELVIFRVVQECLTNVHRHSGSSEANISIQRLPDAVEFQISDRGKGIAPQKQRELATASAGVGVRGMFERIRQFGGTLEIHSSNEGTRVKGRLPLPVDASEIAS
ncbi:MAG: hypothetical protein QOD84_1112 [Acidobacteriaceae bacterium]|jgi:PAS domain S-box-containing protein